MQNLLEKLNSMIGLIGTYQTWFRFGGKVESFEFERVTSHVGCRVIGDDVSVTD